MILLLGSPAHRKFHVFCVHSTQVVVYWAIGNSRNCKQKWKNETGILELKSEQMHPNKEMNHLYPFH